MILARETGGVNSLKLHPTCSLYSRFCMSKQFANNVFYQLSFHLCSRCGDFIVGFFIHIKTKMPLLKWVMQLSNVFSAKSTTKRSFSGISNRWKRIKPLFVKRIVKLRWKVLLMAFPRSPKAEEFQDFEEVLCCRWKNVRYGRTTHRTHMRDFFLQMGTPYTHQQIPVLNFGFNFW